MPRTVRNAKLDTRSARAKLKPRREPYWAPVAPGCALGYLRGSAGGTWIARHYHAEVSPRLRYQALGSADDTLDADGEETLSLVQAQEKARSWFTGQARKAAGFEPAAVEPHTVREAVTDYLASMRGGLRIARLQIGRARQIVIESSQILARGER